jgi:hypothetical protein
MPRTQRVKEPSPVTVLVGQQENFQAADQKSPQEREEKTSTWFWDLLQSKPADDWKAGLYQVWISRLGDSRVPMAAGEKGYLDMFIEPITFATVKQKYGGGKYQAVLNYRGRAETSHNFEIVGQPIYDERRERPGNSSAVQATQAANADSTMATQFISILREEMNHLREGNQGSTAANDATVEIMANAAKRAADIMEKQLPQAGNPATMFKDFASAMKEMGVIGGQQHGSTLGSLIQELTPLITLLTPVLGKFFTPTNPLEQATQFMALMDKVDALRGKGGPSRGTSTNDLILEGINKLPEMIRTLQAEKQPAQAPQQIRRFPAPGPQPGFPQHAPQGAAPHAPTNANAAPFRVTPIHEAGGAAEPGQPEVQGGQPAAEPGSAEDFHTAWVKRNIVEMFAMGQDAEKIAVFIDMQKPDLAADIGHYDVQSILGMIAMDPILGQLTQIPFHELKIEAIRKELIAMAAEDLETEEEELAPAKVN